MTPLLVAAGALVAIGAAVATGARDARIASLGLAVMLAAAPFVADPLPGPLQLAFALMKSITQLPRLSAKMAIRGLLAGRKK